MLGNSIIIASYAGTGKTTAAALYPKTVIDFVCMPYKYALKQDDDAGEAGKANPNNVMRDEWPRNYINALKAALTDNRVFLIPTDLFVLGLLQRENIPYWLVYPQREARDVYHKRYLERGNTEDFIDVFIGGWDSFLNTFEQDTYGRHIVLEPHQYLSDVLPQILSGPDMKERG